MGQDPTVNPSLVDGYKIRVLVKTNIFNQITMTVRPLISLQPLVYVYLIKFFMQVSQL